MHDDYDDNDDYDGLRLFTGHHAADATKLLITKALTQTARLCVYCFRTLFQIYNSTENLITTTIKPRYQPVYDIVW